MTDILSLSKLLLFYKNREVQNALVEHAKDKEIAVKFGEKGFGKRPDTLQYQNDILELVKQGATSFHASEELWQNPLQLDTLMKKSDIEKLRKGWDLVLDIDCKFLEYSQIAADLVIKALRHHGIKSVSCKFSGNHGFHIAIPFEAFPETVHDKDIKELFPEAPRRIAAYLKEMTRKHLGSEILKKDDINTIVKKTGKTFTELVPRGEFDPFKVLEIDTILISSRHLYRMPYSFNEKSGLISVPIDPSKVLEFDKKSAEPEKVAVNKFVFLNRKDIVKNEAKQLIMQAFDFSMRKESEMEELRKSRKEYGDFEALQQAIPEEFFPPCIRLGLQGMEDGKKRFTFILVNFLTSVGWDYEKIEKILRDWNKKNKEELREVTLVGQLRYHKQQKKKILPPNCANGMYYKEIGLCHPDNLCQRIKNPVNYAKRKVYYLNREKEKENNTRKKKNPPKERLEK